jgi:predicted PurR-regulated permease PerM
VGLLIIGVPHAILFGFMASILTFIPYVGIMIASLAPITVAWVTTNSLWYPMGVVIVFSVVQYLEANIIFPWAVSQRMKINTLATFIAIIIGGILWGGAGLILFIPFAGIVKLIADHSPSLKALAVFMDGEVHSNEKVDKKKG